MNGEQSVAKPVSSLLAVEESLDDDNTFSDEPIHTEGAIFVVYTMQALIFVPARIPLDIQHNPMFTPRASNSNNFAPVISPFQSKLKRILEDEEESHNQLYASFSGLRTYQIAERLKRAERFMRELSVNEAAEIERGMSLRIIDKHYKRPDEQTIQEIRERRQAEANGLKAPRTGRTGMTETIDAIVSGVYISDRNF
ncbi:hypothetical protein PROFUN_02379 [Planoprotostelium fungivorum]|uniref:Uncharacterized protein n=1 Tax=Planoprotostelium fungivorum TaxID=1890364 RepID=A0A2P6NUN5_9EUKA|nr:hypothetical protein PROFUN_02379 [Planoprotostelium fungivorum]